MVNLSGYRGDSLKLLGEYQVSIGDSIVIETDKAIYEGILMPRYEFADDQHIVIKLKNGYNIGINIKRIKNIIKKSEKEELIPITQLPPISIDRNLPKVSIVSTGGTIASRIDYRTGGVHPALSASDLYNAIPELSKYAQINTEILFNLYSENIEASHWKAMAIKIAEKIKEGFQGVVITHGTDTMGYTSAALSFALINLPIPVAIVGSQRSSDRPSSDAALNLIGGVVLAAKAPFSGVYVVMHSSMNDDILAVHLGTRVRKNHTSRRDAFESIDISPVAYIKNGNVEKVLNNLPMRKEDCNYQPRANFDNRVALLKFYPNFDPSIIEYLIDRGYKGIVLEGTGLGHVSNKCYPALKKAIDNGLLVMMTSQCIWGRVRMTVYETGRDLLKIGVIPLEGMLPETALVKAMWVLANTNNQEDAKKLMLMNLVGEYAQRSPLERRPKDGIF